MSDYSSLKATINANIKANNNHEITGAITNSVLNAMVNSLGAGYQFIGVATPTNPGSAQTPDYKCFYLATTPGTYTNLGGLVVADGEVAILKYDTSWTKEVSGIASADKLNQLEQEQKNLIGFDKKVQLYNNDNGYPIIKKVGTSLYFKSSNGQWAGRCALNLNYTNAELATALGVELVDISASDTGYIELPDEYSFVLSSSDNRLHIKSRDAVTFNDVVLLANVGGYIEGLNTDIFGYPYIEHLFDEFAQRAQDAEQQINTRESFRSKVQFYNNGAAYPIIKKVGTSLYFKSSADQWAGRGAFNLNYTNAALATAMGVELVDISASDTGYIELPDEYSFVISSSGPAIKSRNAVTLNDAVLLANVGGYIKGLNTDIFGYPYIEHIISEFDTRITALENDDISPWVTENTDVLIPQIREHQTSKGITFAFLTDLHNEAYPSIYNPNNNIIARIKRMVQGINIIKKDIKLWATLVGGDYLVNSNTTIKSNALKALVDVTVSLNSINDLPKLMIKGNHDDNSMGLVADAINPEEFYDNSAKLFEENEIIIDSNNPSGCYGYLDIKPQKVRIIFLNSQDIPWIVQDDSLKYKGQWTKGVQQAQLNFVKKALTFNESGWGVIFASHHGVVEIEGYSTGGDSYITPENGGSQLYGIIKAFKDKTTFSGTITGDFASVVSVDFTNNASNQVICLLNGHTHCDRNAVKDGMLFLSTTTATQSNVDTNTDGSSYMPVANTKNEAAMDFITVDKLSGIIYLDRYGFGVSRKFYYTGDDIGEIPT